MANCEKDVYGEVRKGCRKLSGRSEKLSDRHRGGIPDMYTSTPKYGAVWVEVKYEVLPKRKETPIKVDLSALQRNWIRDEQLAGGYAGWLLCVKVSPRLELYFAGTDPNVTHVKQSDPHFTRKAGETLNMAMVLEIITGRRHNADLGPGLPPTGARTPRLERVRPDEISGGPDAEERALVRRSKVALREVT